MASVRFRYVNYLRRTRKRHSVIASCPQVANRSIIVGYG